MGATDAGGPVVAVFGGSFNPPHVGHVLAVAYVLACVEVDRVLVVPCFRHPFAKALASFQHRVEMCRLAFSDLQRAEISTVEEELGGDSLTVRTLEYLQQKHPDWSLRLVLGGDVVPELPRWTRPDRIVALAKPIILGRAGVSLPPEHGSAPTVLPDVSSSSIREALARGESPGPMLPLAVAEYIRAHGLYS
jgi:nicotinate-nucleotide adenylyltransferase